MKCEFCNDSVVSACVTCDAPLCKYHCKGAHHGECLDCWLERCECEDCGCRLQDGSRLCSDCYGKPPLQYEIHAQPSCAGCGTYNLYTRVCDGCEKSMCLMCTRESCSSPYCNTHFCYMCANRELEVCQPCERERQLKFEAFHGTDPEFWPVRVPSKALCWHCYNDHRLTCYHEAEHFYRGPWYSDDDESSHAETEDDEDDAPPWPLPLTEDPSSLCSMAA
jgi:hypothetical protein